MASFLDFDEIVKKTEDYLVDVTNYSREQAGTVTIACENNQYEDTEDFIKDFAVEFDECILIDDDAFTEMFPNDDDRKVLFANIQKALHQIHPLTEEQKQDTDTIDTPQHKYRYEEIVNMDVTALTHQHLQSIKHLYQKQAKSLLTKNDDIDLYRILALGRSHDLPLMQNLADTYSRMKINGRIHDLKEFKETYKLLNELRVPSTRNTFEMAPASFHRRGLPETQIDPEPLIKIDDDLNHFYLYGKSCIAFISNLLTSSGTQQAPLTPFQIDFWIIPKKSGAVLFDHDEDSSDDDDEDDDSDSESNFHDEEEADEDIPSNITGILDTESLVYKKKMVQEPDFATGGRTERMMRDQYIRFVQELQSKTKDKNAPQFRRVNMILDRRKRNIINKTDDEKTENDNDNETEQKEADEFFIYAPPDDCNEFDYHSDGGHVPEIFIANTKKCTLPKHGYSKADNEMEKSRLAISASDQLNGSNFIMSFHVQAVDDIKCYVYFNGTCVRFFPEDMVTVWPKWFKQSEANDRFIKKSAKLLDGLKSIKIRDDRFEQWYEMTTGFDDLHLPLAKVQKESLQKPVI